MNDLERWRVFLQGLDDLGETLTGDGFPASPADHTEGLRHLALQTVCWLGWAVGYRDPRHPFFQRQNDLVTQWGGPNADNVYRHARIDPTLRYRITGKMHSCEDFILAIRRNFMHMEGSGHRRRAHRARRRHRPRRRLRDPARRRGRRAQPGAAA